MMRWVNEDGREFADEPCLPSHGPDDLVMLMGVAWKYAGDAEWQPWPPPFIEDDGVSD